MRGSVESVLCEGLWRVCCVRGSVGSVDMRGSVGSVLCERVCGECVV